MKTTHIIGAVDVTRVRIDKPTHSPWEYWSAKDKFHALKYEIAVSLQEDFCMIIWCNGTYRGVVNDRKVFKHRLRYLIPETEEFLADSGYSGVTGCFTPNRRSRNPDVLRRNNKLESKRITVERCNQRIKNFSCISDASSWRHSYSLNCKCMSVICKLLNLSFQRDPIFPNK